MPATDTGQITTHLGPTQPAFTTVTPTGGLVPDNPLPLVPSALIWSQPHQVDRGSYTAPTLNATNATYATAYLIGDTGFGGEFDDTLTFTRRWATKPAAWTDIETLAVTYPGYYDALGNWIIRRPYSEVVPVLVERTYFLIGTGGDYATVDLIPLDAEARVTDTEGLNVALISGVDINNDDGSGVYAPQTTPSLDDYLDLVDDDNASQASYSLVISSIPERYHGNIWCRVTKKVKAK